MKLLITGGCGFLGAHLVEGFLKHTTFDIVILDKLSYASSGFDRLRDIGVYGNGPNYKPELAKRVKVLGCDLSQPIPEGMSQEIGDVDYIIHAAAETHVDNSIKDPMPFLQSNIMGTHHLLWWAKTLNGLKRILAIGTDEVYGPATFDNVEGFDEDARFRPANPYAAAKASAEMLCMAYSNTYKIPITVVNTMNLLGERQAGEKMVPKIIRHILEDQEMPIHADPTRTFSGTRFYIHCRNFASALMFLIEQDQQNNPPPLKIHVRGEQEISNLELAEMIAQFINKPLKYQLVDFHSSRPGHDLRYAMSDKLIKRMGWQQPIDIERSLEKTVKWYLDNQQWLYIGIKS